MKYGIIFSYWDKDWEAMDFKSIVERASQAGADCVEMMVDRTMEWSDARIKDFVQYAKDKNVEILFNGGVTNETCTYSEDPEVRRAGVERVRKLLKQTAKFGVRFMDGGFSEGWPSKPGRVITNGEKRAMTDRAIGSIKEMAETAEDLGILMSMEIVNRFEGFLANTAEEAHYIVSSVDSPNFKVTMDTFHMNIEEDSIEGGFRLLGKKYICHVHLGEANRKLPGKGGQIDWDKVFGVLHEIGYDGRLLLEPFVLAEGTVAQNVFLWRDLSGGASADGLTSELRESFDFVRSKYEA